MKIEFHPKHPPVEPINVTTAYSPDFADFLRELKQKRDFEKIDGSFSMYRDKKGIVIELDFQRE